MNRNQRCPDCGALPGQCHQYGCDVERCPRCGGQSISCDCIYEFCLGEGVDLENDYPEIYRKGPTDEMCEQWDKEWQAKRLPWTGEWPGHVECREFGFWCVGPPWVSVPAGTLGATEDLNRLYTECTWDQDKQRFVQRR